MTPEQPHRRQFVCTPAVVESWADLAHDRNPLHLDPAFAAKTRFGRPIVHGHLMAAVEVEDLIGLIDVQLGAAHDRNDALPLWRQRVALLEDLATIRGSAYAIVANDTDPSRDANASLNRIN